MPLETEKPDHSHQREEEIFVKTSSGIVKYAAKQTPVGRGVCYTWVPTKRTNSLMHLVIAYDHAQLYKNLVAWTASPAMMSTRSQARL